MSPRTPNALQDTPHPALRATFSHKGRREESRKSIRAQLGLDHVGGLPADHESNNGSHFARLDGSMHHADDSH
jgi:hypothetical protein